MSTLLNDLNISFKTAKAALKGSRSAAVKSFSINSIVSEEDEEELRRQFGNKPPQNEQQQKRQKKPKGKNKQTAEKPLTFTQYMKNHRPFNYCQSRFFHDKQPPKQVLNIRKALEDLLGEEYISKDMPLFKTMGSTTKMLVVKYKYYYYSITSRRTLVKDECFATWIACALSEAVNKGNISKIDYYVFVKKYNLLDVVKPKKKAKPAKKRPWVSIISVPFGGMNRR